MGKGDKRSFKGKLFKGSYGKTRRRKGVKKAATAATARKK
jgi:ribosomal small subunit protein bTHX